MQGDSSQITLWRLVFRKYYNCFEDPFSNGRRLQGHGPGCGLVHAANRRACAPGREGGAGHRFRDRWEMRMNAHVALQRHSRIPVAPCRAYAPRPRPGRLYMRMEMSAREFGVFRWKMCNYKKGACAKTRSPMHVHPSVSSSVVGARSTRGRNCACFYMDGRGRGGRCRSL